MTSLGAFNMVLDGEGGVWFAGGVDQKTGLPVLVDTKIKADRVLIPGAGNTMVLADNLHPEQAKDAAAELKTVLPNASIEIMTGTAVLNNRSITMMGVQALSTASWFLVVRSKSNPGQSGLAFNPLGIRVSAWLEKNGKKGFGDGTSLADIPKQIPALVPGLAAEIL